MKIKKSTIVVCLIIVAGVGLLIYPTFSNWWNSKHQSSAIGSYLVKTDEVKQDEKHKLYKSAQEYNKNLIDRDFDRFKLKEYEKIEYNNLLKVSGSEIMSVVEIPSLNIKMPVYHGTDEAVLQVAIGHIAGSSLPIGGKGTHSVISGHTGLASARLFTDIEKLSIGDIFTIKTLDETLTYQVDQKKVVLPKEIDELRIYKDKDFLTLQTCTPYGINTHRLLVRGQRIDNKPKDIAIYSDATQISSILVNSIIGSIFIIFILIFMFIVNIIKRLLKKSFLKGMKYE